MSEFLNLSSELDYFPEPKLEFGLGQYATNPKAGLYLYGPVDGRPRHIKTGVIGTAVGLKLYKEWAEMMNIYIPPGAVGTPNHIAFPGFSSAFGASINNRPELEIELSAISLSKAIRLGRRHEAIKETVSLYEEAIRRRLDEDISLDVWFVVVPDEIYKYGRPQSVMPRNEAVKSNLIVTRKQAAHILAGSPSLFPEENLQAETYLFEPNFHHQLKARLLDTRSVVLQIMRESTLRSLIGSTVDAQRRRMQDPASIAWNLSTALYFKGGYQPWRLAKVRPRVCYIGLVFKRFPDAIGDDRKACCGAQMFLDSGNGLVFRGTPGNWYNPTTKQFHLSESEARSLVQRVVAAYKSVDADGLPPTELFIHGRTRFDSDEWKGFVDGAGPTKVNAIRISDTNEIKLYSLRDTPVLRGTALRLNDRRGYLWTKGYINELGTYPGREVPKPLSVEIVHGDADLKMVMQDVLMLTKLNFNACIYADGSPVTLRFADAVGEIITAVPERRSMGSDSPLPFKHYI